MRRPVVCVYLRAPMRGAVKRRLARDIGDRAAHRFYVETTRRLLRRLADERRWSVALCVTPDRFARTGRFWLDTLDREPQGYGGLGARMTRTLLRHSPGPVALIGSDIPDLGPAQLHAAFDALGRHDLVFGPATDGGFWLVAARDFRRFRRVFDHVRWSTGHALADALARSPVTARVACLKPLDDVDTGADLARLTRR